MRCNRGSSTCTKAVEGVFDLMADKFPLDVFETVENAEELEELVQKSEQDLANGSSAFQTLTNA